MNIVKTGISAIGKLLILGVLALTFFAGLIGVVYLSLRGEELKIPEIVGKDFVQSEKDLESMGLKIKKVATRYSQEKPNTILEQRPSAGEMGKTGLMVSVVVAQANADDAETPAAIIKKAPEEAETTADLEIPSDKVKKTNKNTNTKRASTTRDVASDKANKNSNSNSAAGTNSSTVINPSRSNSAPTPTVPNTKPGTATPPPPAIKPGTAPAASPKPQNAKTPNTAKTPGTLKTPTAEKKN